MLWFLLCFSEGTAPAIRAWFRVGFAWVPHGFRSGFRRGSEAGSEAGSAGAEREFLPALLVVWAYQQKQFFFWPSTVRSGEWPAWFSFWFSGRWQGACRRHGVGGFLCAIQQQQKQFLFWKRFFFSRVSAGGKMVFFSPFGKGHAKKRAWNPWQVGRQVGARENATYSSLFSVTPCLWPFAAKISRFVALWGFAVVRAARGGGSRALARENLAADRQRAWGDFFTKNRTSAYVRKKNGCDIGLPPRQPGAFGCGFSRGPGR